MRINTLTLIPLVSVLIACGGGEDSGETVINNNIIVESTAPIVTENPDGSITTVETLDNGSKVTEVVSADGSSVKETVLVNGTVIKEIVYADGSSLIRTTTADELSVIEERVAVDGTVAVMTSSGGKVETVTTNTDGTTSTETFTADGSHTIVVVDLVGTTSTETFYSNGDKSTVAVDLAGTTTTTLMSHTGHGTITVVDINGNTTEFTVDPSGGIAPCEVNCIGVGEISFLNLVSDAPSLTVVGVDGDTLYDLVSSDLFSYGLASDPVNLHAGLIGITVFASGVETLSGGSALVVANQNNLHVISGQYLNDDLKLTSITLAEDVEANDADTSAIFINVAHMNHGIGNLDVYFVEDGGEFVAGEPIATLSEMETSADLRLTNPNHELIITESGSDTILFRSGSLTLSDKLNQTIILSASPSEIYNITAFYYSVDSLQEWTDQSFNPCDSTFDGESEIIVDSFSDGVLRGHIEGGTLKSVSITTRDGLDFDGNIRMRTYDGKTEGDCTSFTITNIPSADALTARRSSDVRDSIADYSIEVVNNAGNTSSNNYLARGAELENVGAVQINNSVFEGTNGLDGITTWLESMVSSFDIIDWVTNPAEGKPLISNPTVIQGVALTPADINLSLVDPANPSVDLKTALAGILKTTPDKLYAYVTAVTLGGEQVVDNGARLNMEIVENSAGGFGIKVSVSFVGDTPDLVSGTSTIVTAKFVTTDAANVVTGEIDLNITIPDAAITLNINAESTIEKLLSLTMAEGSSAFNVVGSAGKYAQPSDSNYGSTVSDITLNCITAGMCNVGAAGSDLDSLFRNFVILEDLVPDSIETAIGTDLRNLVASMDVLVGEQLVDLDSGATPAQAKITSMRGLVTEANEASIANGGFISAGGAVVYNDTPVKLTLGSYFETGGSVAVKNANFGTTEPVINAISESSINQMLLARFESGEYENISMPPFKFSELNIAGLEGMDHIDVHLVRSSSTPPHINIGSSTNQAQAVMKGLKLKMILDGTGSMAGTSMTWTMDHAFDIYMSPVGAINYAIVNGMPQAAPVANSDIDLNISRVDVIDADVNLGMNATGINSADLQAMMAEALKPEVGEVMHGIGESVLPSQTVTIRDLAPSDGSATPVVFAHTLPRSVGLVLTQVSSDADGKFLLLSGDIKVEPTAIPSIGINGAIHSYILCDSNAVFEGQDYCEGNH